MANLPKILIGLAALAFVLAVISSLAGELLPTPPEAFSRASTNLALIAIALLLLDRNRGPGVR